MNWTIKFSSQAEKYYKKLPKQVRQKTKNSLTELGSSTYPLFHKNVLPLSGELHGFYRLRVGEYRIIFSILEKEQIIAIVNFYPRGDVYKK
jgi:mRNA interferase RelE/StbE